MSGDGVQPAFLEAGERRRLLCEPPPGPFDKDSPALVWVPRGYAATQYRSVYIPTDRYHGFLAGEGARAGCALYVKRSERAEGRQRDDKVDFVRANARLDKVVMHCPRGPQDYRSQAGKATEKQAGQRLKRVDSGLSIRVGCVVHFAARRQPDTPDITEIMYYHWEHSESCRAIPRAHRISAELRKEVVLQWRLGVPARDIVHRNQNSYLAAVMAEGMMDNRDIALKALSEQQMPRDFYLSLQDVANICRMEDKGAAEQPQKAQRTPTATSCTSRQHDETAAQRKKAALEAMSRFVACADELPEDSPYWQWLTVAANQGHKTFHEIVKLNESEGP